MLQHQLGVVAAGFLLDHRGHARRGKPGQQHRGFDLRRGHRRLVDDRQRIARAAAASAAGGRPRRLSTTVAPISSSGSRMRRIGRLRSEASPSNIAVIGQPATAPITSRQPVPELPKSSGACRLGEAGDADAVHGPGEIAGALDPGAQRLHRFGGVEDVLALQKAGNPGFADRTARPGSGRGARSTCRREPGRCRSGGRWRGLQRGRLVGMGQDCVLWSASSRAGITWAAPRHAAVISCANRY